MQNEVTTDGSFNGQQGMMVPGMMPPGMVQPGMMHPGMDQPGMMPPGMMPGFPNMPQAPMSLSEVDLRRINVEGMMSFLTRGIYIKQKMCVFEALTGIDTPNRYFVYEMSNTGQGG